jgi:hypothetical protein
MGLSPNPARETLSVLLDGGSTANRLDEPDFAGVCPMACPDPAATKFHLNRVA